MAHDPKAERRAGMLQNQRERYGFQWTNREIVKSVPRKPAVTDQAVVGVTKGDPPPMVSVGKDMKHKP